MKIKVRKLNSCWEKCQGLIGKELPEAVFFETRFGIHTFGLKFPIDVVVVDNSFKVVVVKENLKPNRLYFWDPHYKNVLELASGSVVRGKVLKGTQLALDFFTAG